MDTVKPENIELLFSQLMRRIHAHPSRKPVLRNISFAQMRIVWILGTRGELSMSQIAELTGVTRATVSSIVGRLVKAKFVSRIRNKQDRRIVKLRLIGKGKKFIREKKEQRRKRITQLLENLSPAEQKRLSLCLEELNALISKSKSKEE